MKKAPSIISLDSVIKTTETTTCNLNDKWVPCRPGGFFSVWYRLKAAWGVFTGKYDALYWPEGQ